jgi:hypothetical protein
VTRTNVWPIATQPDPAYGKPTVAAALGNPGFLQQVQRSAAGTEKNELSLNDPMLSALFIPDLQPPCIAMTLQILHPIEKMNGKSILT